MHAGLGAQFKRKALHLFLQRREGGEGGQYHDHAKWTVICNNKTADKVHVLLDAGSD